MVRQVQFRNKLIIIFSVLLLSGCGDVDQLDVLEMRQEGLKKVKGVYYFEEDQVNGSVYSLYVNGDTSEYMQLENGVREGMSRKWWPNGTLKFKGNYVDGLYHGEVAQWYEDGARFTVFNYKMGQEDGRQQAWKSDGSIKANYEVVGDRKYGLTGIKNCSNVWEE